MRKKLLSKTYLWDTIDYKIKFIINDNLDYYLCVKKIINRVKPFIISGGNCLIDNNYSILEVLPKNENYSMRVYLNEKNEILQYYFDISLKNGLDEDTLIPYYDDLYLDVIYNNGNIELLDYNELEEALHDGIIDDTQFNLAKETSDKLIEELKNKTNKYFNINFNNELFK